MSAIANAAALQGESFGYIMWGVRDGTLELVGTNFDPHAAHVGSEAFLNWLQRYLDPRVTITCACEFVDNKRIALLRIPAASQNVVRFKGEQCIRIGSYTNSLKDHPHVERQLWAKLNSVQFESQIARDGLSCDEINHLCDLRVYFDLHGRPLPPTVETQVEHLVREGLIAAEVDGTFAVSQLCAILLARQLADFGLERKSPRIIQYEKDDRVSGVGERVVTTGYAASFAPVCDAVLGLTESRESIQGHRRSLASVFPDIAIREVVANALIHQDFSEVGAGPMIEVFRNRVVVTNPGTALVPVSRFLDSPPKSRNDRLASHMRRLGFVEERGSGVDKVVAAIEEQLLPAPEFRVHQSSTQVVLHGPRAFADMERDERLRAVYLHACLLHERSGRLTNTSLRSRFGLSADKASTISRLISEAVEAGLIRAVGGARKGAEYLPFYAIPFD